MKCPKCGNDMTKGEISVSANTSRGWPVLFWATSDVFNRMFPQLLTAKKAASEGGVQINLGNGWMKPRNVGYICKECKCVLMDY